MIKDQYNLCRCGNVKTYNSKRCRQCYHKGKHNSICRIFKREDNKIKFRKLGRPCDRCGERFERTGPYQYLCGKCLEEKELKRKGWQ